MIQIASDGELLSEQAQDVAKRRCNRQGYQFRGVEGSSKIWKRFTILPNIDGQKFTIGNNFTSPEEQGELIFWNKDGKDIMDDTEPNTMCQIEIDKKKFWVTPLEENLIYINDNKIEMRTELKFGDYLTLGKEEDWQKDNFHSYPPYPSVLWFNKRDLNPEIVNICGKPDPDSQEDSSTLTTQEELTDLDDEQAKIFGGQIPTALSLILSYLPFESLLTSRLVSKHWNDEAENIMRKKCYIHFRYGHEDNCYIKTNRSLPFSLYNLEMDQSFVQNWNMHLPSLGTEWHFCQLDTSSGRPGDKFLSDLDTFLSRPHPSIRRLVLKGAVHGQPDFDAQLKILNHLAPNLEDLNLDWNWHVTNYPYVFPIFNFSKLVRFSFSCFEEEEKDEFSSKSSWFQPLITAIQGVKSLRLLFHGYSFLDEGCTASFSNFFLKQINSFPNLEELTLLESPPSHIQLLLNLEKPLKKLELVKLMDLEAENVPDFEKLLQKHASTLESLLLIIPQFHKATEIRLPIMPKLKRLNIRLADDHEDFPIGIKLIFSGGLINYAKDFPSLQSLKVWPWAEMNEIEWKYPISVDISNIALLWDDYSAFFEQFFPNFEQGQKSPKKEVCKSLRELDIPFEDRDENVFPRAAEVAAQFPNVRNKWMNKARETIKDAAEDLQPISILVNASAMSNADNNDDMISQANDNVCQCVSPRL